MCKKLIFLISLILVFALYSSNAVQADTIDVRVSTSAGDVEEAVGDGAVYDDSSDLEIIYDDYVNDDQIIGLRFVGVSIPQGATITSAYIEFECDEVKDTDPVNVVINGELAADAAAFTTTASDVSNRTLTAAQVSWSIPSWAVNDKSQSSDISSIIQEIVDQGGWAAGNALVITIKDDTSDPSTGTRTAEAYDGEAANAPLLHVEFEGGGGGPASGDIWFEAEDADPLTAPMETYDDDPGASGGKYIGVAPGNNSTGASPAPDGTASYVFDVPETGTYKVVVRMKISPTTYDDDSCWFRIDGATQSSGSGWVKWNGLADGHLLGDGGWHWVTAFNDDDGRAEVEYTMDAGQYVLEIAYREDGLYFDAILITDDLALDPSTLPDEIPSGGGGPSGPPTVTGTYQTAVVNTDWAATPQDVTALSTDGDWRLWEDLGAPAYEKDTSDELIGDLVQVLSFNTYDPGSQNFTWSDGVAPVSSPSTGVGIGSRNVGEGLPLGGGYQVDVTLPTGTGDIVVWAGTRSGPGRLVVLDGSTEVLSLDGDDRSNVWGLDRFDIAVSNYPSSTVLTIQWILADDSDSSARINFYGVAFASLPGGGAAECPALAYYKFEDDATDSSGNGHDGTIVGTVGWTAGAPGFDSGIEFANSSADYVVIDDGLLIDPTEMGFTAWIKCNSIGGWMSFANQANGGAQWAWWVDASGNIGMSTNSQAPVFSTGVATAGEWMHVAFSYDGFEITMYCDGEVKGTSTTTINSTVGMPLYIGALTSGYPVGFDGVIDEVAFFDTVLTQGEIQDYMNNGVPLGAAPPAIVKATKPDPANGTTDLTRFNVLSWTPGDFADSHDVYLGTDQQAVTDATIADPMGVLVSQQQLDAFYVASGDYGKTYYWRIDEVDETDMTVYPGDVWKFSTKAIGLIVPQSSITATASSQKDEEQGPEKTIDGSGLNAQDQHGIDNTTMWLSDATNAPDKAWIRYDFDRVYKMPRMLIWNHNLTGLTAGYAIKSVTIEYSSDGGENWTVLADPNELPQGTGTDTLEPLIVDLGGVADGLAINALRITANSNYRSMLKNYGLSEVRFYYIPVWPTNPSPANGATGVSVVNPKLTWTAGEGVVEHEVYFGTDAQAVTDGTAASSIVADTSFTPPPLTLGTMYYWRVVEVNMASVPSGWSGPTWSFTASAYTVVDDFEGSSLKWTGGSSSSGNGAAVLLDTAIKNGGNQSMQFLFDDTSTQGYSETSANPAQLTSTSNWTIGGPKYLVFQVYGDLANITTERLYVKLNDATYWYQQDLIPDSELVTPWWTQVQIPLIANQVTLNNVTSLKIGFIRTESKTGTGKIHIDDIRLYKEVPTPLLPVNPGDANLVAWYKMENNANDSAPAPKINGTAAGDPNYVSGPFPGYGKAMEFDRVDDYVNLGSANPFNFTGSYSIAFWLNVKQWSDGKMIATSDSDSMGFSVGLSTPYGHYLRYSASGLGYAIPGWGTFTYMMAVFPGSYDAGEWIHIICTYDAVNATNTVYFNGVLGQQVAIISETKTLIPSTKNASLGAGANADNTAFVSMFGGYLDDVRFYDKVLSAGEIKFLLDPTP